METSREYYDRVMSDYREICGRRCLKKYSLVDGVDHQLLMRSSKEYSTQERPEEGQWLIETAEGSIRPFTVYRKNFEHFDSESGVSNVMVYMMVIETLRMCGYNVKEYLERIFTYAIKGISDHSKYTPSVMALTER